VFGWGDPRKRDRELATGALRNCLSRADLLPRLDMGVLQGPCGEEWDPAYDGIIEKTPPWGNPRSDGISLACMDSLVENNVSPCCNVDVLGAWKIVLNALLAPSDGIRHDGRGHCHLWQQGKHSQGQHHLLAHADSARR
jgi:hypothetical protein